MKLEIFNLYNEILARVIFFVIHDLKSFVYISFYYIYFFNKVVLSHISNFFNLFFHDFIIDLLWCIVISSWYDDLFFDFLFQCLLMCE